MTKEDMLQDLSEHYEWTDREQIRIEEKMDEYAEQECIGFDQWKHNNHYVQYLGFDTPSFHKEKPIAGKQVYFSSKELYQIYLQSKK